MSFYKKKLTEISSIKSTWCITGVAGFIGSNLLESLLRLDQKVIGLDNFSTGSQLNLDEVKSLVSSKQWSNFSFFDGDITDLDDCRQVTANADFVLHQAALGSVPRSIKDPINTHSANISGFLNMLIASRDASVKSFVYAASSSTYGDHPDLPKIEENIGNPLSPYAVTKYVNELYADVFDRTYDFRSIGLRYFNVFGKRQNPNGDYAAVIPKWISAMINNKNINIYGDGKTSRDFCYVENVIQANILSAILNKNDSHKVFNVAVGDRTSLDELYEIIKNSLKNNNIHYEKKPNYTDFRDGDVRHSQASINKAIEVLSYSPEYTIRSGIDESIHWYIKNLSN